MEALEHEEYYTYEDWLNINDGKRYELLDGILYMMAQPLPRHQTILAELVSQLVYFLRNKPCNVYPAPYAVRLHKDKDTAFEPDIVVVCDPSKQTNKGCIGAPDLIMEILSSSTSRYDKITKFNEYLRAGVLEYWIVDPVDKTIIAYRLKDGAYFAEVYADTDIAKPQVLPGCEIDLSLVFHE